MSRSTHLEIIPLGGLGEFGMNSMVYRHGSDCLLVDAGMMFPGAEHLGVDVVVPNLSFLEDCGTLHGVVLTHAHEDHIGALPHVLARHDIPVYSTAHTRGLLRVRLEEHGLLRAATLRTLPDDRETVSIGPFTIECIRAAHSIPMSKMLLIRTPVGNIFHTADYKLDPLPLDGQGTDLARLAEIGREGVLAMMSDSTNADRPGFTPGERDVVATLDRLLDSRKGRILVTTFSSNMTRVQHLARLAERHGRRIALIGTSLQTHAHVGTELGLVSIPSHTRARPDQVMSLPRERVLIVATGSQGEPMSALARIAVGKHRDIAVEDGDLVIHSARSIPGNEKSIGRMINHLLRRGADVLTANDAMVHVSGHPSQDELRIMLQLLRPKFLVPIHGEYRQLHAHARLAVQAGFDEKSICLAESGDVIALDERSIEIVDRVHVGQVFIDATLDQVDWAILKERRQIAGDGILVPVVSLDRETGEVSGEPEIVARGFVPAGESGEEGVMTELRRIVVESVRDASPEERTDEAMLKARIQTDLRRYLRRRKQRRPLILPVIVEF